MTETFLRTATIKDNDVLQAISDIFDGSIDADWSGDNEEEFWTEEARELHKCDKDIVEEQLASRKFETPERLVSTYIQEYVDRFGRYYEDIVFDIKYDENDNPSFLAMAFTRED